MNIRLAKKSDIWLLYNWVNKPDSIKNKMITSKDISKSEHILWYETSFDNKNRFIWIIEEDKVALGQIRFDIEEEKKNSLKGYAVTALHHLRHLVENASSEAVRLGAIKDVLDRAGFKPIDRQQVE